MAQSDVGDALGAGQETLDDIRLYYVNNPRLDRGVAIQLGGENIIKSRHEQTIPKTKTKPAG